MKEVILTIQLVITLCGGYIGWFLGGFDGMVNALVAFVVIDYVTGLMVAVLTRKVSSAIGFKGIFKKVLIFTFVGLAHMIDSYILGQGGAIRSAEVFFYLSNEGLSILENSAKVGLPIPDKLKRILLDMREEDTHD